MKYGLSDIELNKLREFYARYEDIEEVILYGSRAKGNHKPFSDVDISLVGANLTRSRLNQIAFAIDDLLLPYQFDLSIFHKLTNMELVDHIRRVGISIFCKDCSQPPAAIFIFWQITFNEFIEIIDDFIGFFNSFAD